jgi:hypothetical protein
MVVVVKMSCKSYRNEKEVKMLGWTWKKKKEKKGVICRFVAFIRQVTRKNGNVSFSP